MSSCLVMIDIQNGFLNRKTEHIVKRIGQLLRSGVEFDHIVATRYKNHDGSSFTRFVSWDGMMDSTSQKLHPLVEIYAERVFDKCTYSCFTMEFQEFLWSKGIDTVYLVGIEIDCCVLTSALSAFDSGIRPVVLEYYCASSLGVDSHQAACLVLEHTIGSNLVKGEYNGNLY